MQTYEGYIEDGQFTSIGQPIKIFGRRRVILTLLDDNVSNAKIDNYPKKWKGTLSALNEPIQVQDFRAFSREELHER